MKLKDFFNIDSILSRNDLKRIKGGYGGSGDPSSCTPKCASSVNAPTCNCPQACGAEDYNPTLLIEGRCYCGLANEPDAGTEQKCPKPD